MGKKGSPTLACLAVGTMEALFPCAWLRQGGRLPVMLQQFKDDIFGLWRCDGKQP